VSPAAAAVLARVRAAGAELRVDGYKLRWRAPEPLPADLLECLKASKDELLAALTFVPPSVATFDTYCQRTAEATSWDDLYAVLTDAEVAYAANEMTGPEVEALARQANARSSDLPDHAPGPHTIAASALLPPEHLPESCHACRCARWWIDRRSGQRICRICHPPPSPEFEE
jgi:hypothetical protein